MRAVRVGNFGGPEVLRLERIPDQVPGTGQVVIDVAAASVLSLDLEIRAGRGGEHFPVQPPYTPGAGVAGTVSSVGSGVPEALVGTRVLAHLDDGGYAERALAEVDMLATVPAGLNLRDAVALLHDGSGALAIFERMDVQPGETVLVQPAAGGLGSFLVQLAHHAGATVVAAARGQQKLALAKDMGADLTVDYGVHGWADRARAACGEVDVVFTGVGGELGRGAFELTRRGGRFSNYGFTGGGPMEIDPEEAEARGVRVHGMEQLLDGVADRIPRIERTVRLAVHGVLKPVAVQAFPLAEADRAHAALENREVVGKAVLVPRDD